MLTNLLQQESFLMICVHKCIKGKQRCFDTEFSLHTFAHRILPPASSILNNEFELRLYRLLRRVKLMRMPKICTLPDALRILKNVVWSKIFMFPRVKRSPQMVNSIKLKKVCFLLGLRGSVTLFSFTW